MPNSIQKEEDSIVEIPAFEKITSKAEVFFNPEMKFNRDISCLVLACNFESKIEGRDSYLVCDSMAASGIRTIRYFKELEKIEKKYKKQIFSIYSNDINQQAISQIENNLRLNKLDDLIDKKIILSQKDANCLVLRNKFDFVDIDPFGSSVYFLNSFFANSMHKSILATTYTDTAPLCGTYPKTCFIRYFAKPAHIDNMHEIALRILIAKINIISAMHEKIYHPLLSFSKRHYFRLFGESRKSSKGKLKENMKNIGYMLYCSKCMERKFVELDLFNNLKICSCGEKYNYAGPLWTGALHDTGFCKKLLSYTEDKKMKDFIEIIKEENEIDGICYSIHEFGKTAKMDILKTNEMISRLKKNGFNASRCHLSGLFVKTDKMLNVKEYRKIVK
ncbi:MAG: hypothetical protein KAI55_02660 [Candidatus Aenigmarchaeota archaeon]|nr:hypothetical protein [Candidatus Aenigmarchaeota archaeon]